MWQVVHSGDNLLGWPPGRALEYLILRAFQLEGADVTWPYEVRKDGVLLEQIDGAVYFDGLACLIEARDWSEPLDFLVIAQLKARLLRRPRMTLGAVCITGTFTEAAIQMAEFLPPPDVLLWDGEGLCSAIEHGTLREGTRRKLRYAIEHGFVKRERPAGGEM
ncbi:restriction endonuclease [Pyxidicoccus trucidator]|uniref:restriction endonuclease n=1 Tax=Pyxidicoccus trucidator TaxID=2709662 RepID=UPI0023DDAAAC|nr:restriction endonuclease [Pyxidicoccus trucidator]